MNYNELAFSILGDSFDSEFSVIFIDTITWLFEYDDLVDNGYVIDINETISMVNEFILNNNDNKGNYKNIDKNLLIILNKINNRFCDSRLIFDNLLAYLYSVIQEREFINKNEYDLCRFFTIKKYNSGFNIVLFMILNEKKIYNEKNYLILDFYCTYISLLNDIFSYNKEKLVEHNPFNFLSLLIIYYDLSYNQALEFSENIIKYCIDNIRAYRSVPVLENICSYADRIVDGYRLWAMNNRYSQQ